jgi:hypothetical protein
MPRHHEDPDEPRFHISPPAPEPWFPVVTDDPEAVLDLREAAEMLRGEPIDDAPVADRDEVDAPQPANASD